MLLKYKIEFFIHNVTFFFSAVNDIMRDRYQLSSVEDAKYEYTDKPVRINAISDELNDEVNAIARQQLVLYENDQLITSYKILKSIFKLFIVLIADLLLSLMIKGIDGVLLVITLGFMIYEGVKFFQSFVAFPQHGDIYLIRDILVSLESDGKHWSSFKHRTYLARQMESLARYYEEYLCRSSKSGDEYTDNLFKHKMQNLANTIRLNKIDILLPDHNTTQVIIIFLARLLEKIMLCDWKSLDCNEVSMVNPPMNRWHRRIILARLLTIGLSPLILLLIIQGSSLHITSPVSDYIIVFCLFWAFVVIVDAYDPTIRDKASFISELLTTIKNKNRDNPSQLNTADQRSDDTDLLNYSLKE